MDSSMMTTPPPSMPTSMSAAYPSMNATTLPIMSAPSNGTNMSMPSMLSQPATLPGGWAYIGCFSSGGSLNVSLVDAAMDLEMCTSHCASLPKDGVFLLAAVYNTDCYCTSYIDGFPIPDAKDATQTSDATCNTPCPGDDTEYCGGCPSCTPLGMRMSRVKRQLVGAPDLTVYANALPAPEEPANATVTATATQTVTQTITYLDVCTTGPVPSVVTTTYCATTVIAPGCPTPVVPMRAVVKACPGCPEAPKGSITCEVPVAIAKPALPVVPSGIAPGAPTGTGSMPMQTMPVVAGAGMVEGSLAAVLFGVLLLAVVA